MRSEWIFETVRSTSKGSLMGSYRSLAQFTFANGQANGNGNTGAYAMPPGMIPDEDFIEEEEEGLAAIEESEDSFDSGAATKGSEEPLGGSGIGVNDGAAHSTVIIRRPSFQDAFDGRPEQLDEPASPGASADQLVAALGAPPAYDTPSPHIQTQTHAQTPSSSSSNSPPASPTKRTSYAERTNTRGRGTQLRPADLGNGVDTIRPVKRVDAAGSLRLSAEYVGAVREREEGGGGTRGSAGSANSGAKDGKESEKEKERKKKEKQVEHKKAGRLMVDDVIVPIMQNVSSSLLSRAVRSVSSFASNPPPPRFCTQGNPRRDGRARDRGAEHARAGVHGPRRRRAGARVPRRARRPPGHQRQLGRPAARAHGTRGACPAQARREEERDDGEGLGGDGAGGGYWCWWWRGGDWRGRRGGERAAGTQCACAAGEYGHDDDVGRGCESDEEEPDCGAVVYAVARGPQAQVAELLVGESDFNRRSRFLLIFSSMSTACTPSFCVDNSSSSWFCSWSILRPQCLIFFSCLPPLVMT